MAHRNRWFTVLKDGGSFDGELLVITRGYQKWARYFTSRNGRVFRSRNGRDLSNRYIGFNQEKRREFPAAKDPNIE
jgi:hypothetical protein